MAAPPHRDPSRLNPFVRSVVDHVQYIMISWRIFPVLLLFFWMQISYEVIMWIKTSSLNGIDAAAVLAAILTPAAAYFKFYVETGANGKFDKAHKAPQIPSENNNG